MFLAHIRETDFEEQTVQTHLNEVAILSRAYGEKAGVGAHAELAGFLHDMGKFTVKFTEYLTNAVIHKQVASEKIDHSTAGAKYLYENYYGQNAHQDFVIETVGMAILSHHSGLQNFIQLDSKPSDYIRRVTKDELQNYDEVVRNFEAIDGNKERVSQLVEEATAEFRLFFRRIQGRKHQKLYASYMQKLVFSCLIDADRTNTRCFEENEKSSITDYTEVFKNSYEVLMRQVNEWKRNKDSINQLRTEMSESCDLLAENPSAIYTLSIPTGGGKTYASLRYALKHAKLYGKSHIIYVVPYTTILEQNAQAVRNIIQQHDAVLEHHANIVDDIELDQECDYYRVAHHKKLQLGRDNWDYPIIFTTMVQFLDSFFQKGTKKARRLHNLTNAIIIFDEVQSVPYKHFSLFNTALNFLHLIGNSGLLLCTATQPAVAHMQYPIELKENAEMVSNLPNIAKAFERVNIHNYVTTEGFDANELSAFVQNLIEEKQSVLVILNTKTAVRKLYEVLSKAVDCQVYHLSTLMCPAHRKDILQNVNDQLGKERIICISTQLIEAGVDISFEAVVRSLAGLDSIAQAAGRCNRNKEKDKGDVYIVRAKDEYLSKLPEIAVGGEVTKNYILRDETYALDILSPKAIHHYFRHFDQYVKSRIKFTPRNFDYEIIQLLNGSINNQKHTQSFALFKTAEQHFEAIDSPTRAILVPYEEGQNIIIALNEPQYDIKILNSLLKQAQQYSVNVYENMYQELIKQGLLAPLFNGELVYLQNSAYSKQYGVSLQGEEALPDYSGY